MIKNEHELKISQQRLKEFRQVILRIEKTAPPPRGFRVLLTGRP